MQIRSVPEEILYKRAEDVSEEEIHSEGFKEIVRRMKEKVLELDALGLAAPQVGLAKRLFVARLDRNSDHILTFINPEILQKKDRVKSHGEGCLSIPGKIFRVPRYKSVVITAKDENGKVFMLTTKTKIAAFVLQHEMDHLDGILVSEKGKEILK